ncbi:ankyrin repeat and SOCS box protein 5b isoform X3 [Anarrhichthys ocellatus]|uniref:ankyrin repeat and SOCS box protein 5b isoform X3 n=1 Tax=Anarrhichthys ocellatus TaxID=433405 RepID=UPI0012EDD92B|nr:ankyrin repeat and SOCS box protein 5-like isoform X3 [Anarrhichthys ocellatus]
MPEVPTGAPEMSRKRIAEPGPLPEQVQERKKACWGILTSQGSWADCSPLHEAASQGRLLGLRTLLAQGYHTNIVTIDHVTPLHEACLSGHVACVRALINAGANVNATTIDGVTPLYNCCASGSVGCVELLLQNGAHTHTPYTHFPSALHEACKRGANVNVGRGGDSPLHATVRQDSADQVSVLLDYGANVNIRDGNDQRPVELALAGGKTQQLLLTFEGTAISSPAVILNIDAWNHSKFRLYHNSKRKSLCLFLGCPRSLYQLCRLQIRNLIGRSRLKLLPLLPLPTLLTDYLEHI